MKTTYFLFTLFIILTSYGIKAGVQYINGPICFTYDCRRMITTTYTGSSESLSGKVEKTTYDNSKNNVAMEYTYTSSETSSRSSSAAPSKF